MGAGTTKVANFGYVAQVDSDGNVLAGSSGGATSAKQDTGNTSLASIDTKLTTQAGYLDGIEGLLAAATPAGTNLIGKVGIDQSTPGTTNGVVVNNSALPTGASTLAAQNTGNSTLTTINSTLGTPFQAGGLVGVKGADGTTIAGPSNGVSVLGTKLNDGSQSSTGGTHLTMGGIDTGTNVYRPLLVDSTGRQVISTLPAGTAIIGKVGIDQTTPGTTNLVAAVGPVASGVAVSGNPLLNGGSARGTTPTAVASGQAVMASYGLSGEAVIAVAFSAATPVATGTTVLLPRSANGSGSQMAVSNYNWNGTNLIPQPGDANGTVTQPYAVTGSRWTYSAASGGIVNTTTAVTIAAAAGASVRNYLPSFQLDWDALGTAMEIAIRDGAGGTVLWRGKIPAGVAGMREVTPIVPLKGTANTLMEFVTLTASVTGGVFFNGQGFTGA